MNRSAAFLIFAALVGVTARAYSADRLRSDAGRVESRIREVAKFGRNEDGARADWLTAQQILNAASISST